MQGVVSRQQIENLPLNGRSFLNLAMLEPGGRWPLGNPAQFNAQFNVSVLGGASSHTRDYRGWRQYPQSGRRRDRAEFFSGSGAGIPAFEHQLRSLDRDHRLRCGQYCDARRGQRFSWRWILLLPRPQHRGVSVLGRTTITNDPFFARRQSGFLLSGPIQKDKAFFFFNLEHTNQNGVYVVQPDLPSVASFATLIPAPSVGTQLTAGLTTTSVTNIRRSCVFRLMATATLAPSPPPFRHCLQTMSQTKTMSGRVCSA